MLFAVLLLGILTVMMIVLTSLTSVDTHFMPSNILRGSRSSCGNVTLDIDLINLA